MRLKPVALPSDLAAAHAMIMAERAARVKAEARATAVCSERDEARAEAANAQADLSSQEALIAHLKLAIEKLRRAIYGSRSERQVRLLDQLELQLEELEAAATEDQLAAEAAAAQTQTVRSFQRKRPVRKPFPADIERERVVIEAPTSCACCGGSRLAKLGEDITETLEEIPRRFKVIETVREKFTCRDCEAITQPPAPFHATPRGYIGPQLLATVLFDKFGLHLPLNRQSRRFKCEGIDLSVSTLADQVGAGVFAAMPLFRLIEAHVMAAERLHGDDTTVPILAKGKTVTGRIGHTFATIGRSEGAHRRQRSITPHEIVAANIRRGILSASPAFLRPTPTAASILSTIQDVSPRRSRLPFVGRTQEGCSSNWPILRRMPGVDDRRRRSRQSRWRRSSASICCSTSSATSTASAPTSACASGKSGAHRSWPN
jgi:transposase